MPRPIVLAGLSLAALALAAPAIADNAANLATQQRARAITMQNRSGTRIAQAQVQTTPDGHVWNIGQGGIGTNEASEVIVPARDCIADIRVQLDGGRVLHEAGLHSCSSTKIVVWQDHINIPEEAVPGAKQHGTPG
ncbi:MAG TPA: hypothetical protein VJ779_18375 [Acetobacteraceae bacterium]|nr:hypothetical protein [Acetobacteraceae bacterium]